MGSTSIEVLSRHSALGGSCSQEGKETRGLYVLGVSGMVMDRLTWGGKKGGEHVPQNKT